MRASLFATVLALGLSTSSPAETVTIATYNVEHFQDSFDASTMRAWATTQPNAAELKEIVTEEKNQDDEDNWEVLSAPDAFQSVRDAVKKLGIEPASAEVSMVPQNYVKLEGKPAQQMVKLMEALEEHDDVQHVWSNFDISAKEIEASLA